jgi:hypothetical protein
MVLFRKVFWYIRYNYLSFTIVSRKTNWGKKEETFRISLWNSLDVPRRRHPRDFSVSNTIRWNYCPFDQLFSPIEATLYETPYSSSSSHFSKHRASCSHFLWSLWRMAQDQRILSWSESLREDFVDRLAQSSAWARLLVVWTLHDLCSDHQTSFVWSVAVGRTTIEHCIRSCQARGIRQYMDFVHCNKQGDVMKWLWKETRNMWGSNVIDKRNLLHMMYPATKYKQTFLNTWNKSELTNWISNSFPNSVIRS